MALCEEMLKNTHSRTRTRTSPARARRDHAVCVVCLRERARKLLRPFSFIIFTETGPRSSAFLSARFFTRRVCVRARARRPALQKSAYVGPPPPSDSRERGRPREEMEDTVVQVDEEVK
ncbi:hypothetical protein GN956_G12132 [Arapaima gigas]